MELIVKDLIKSYGKKEVLKGISYSFTPGIYGLLGINGAGKSTFIKLIADYIRRDGGEITYDGTDILLMKRDFRQKLGYMPQQQEVYRDMTAEAFLFYIASLKGVGKRSASGQIDEVMNAMNLWQYRHDKIGKYSGGMKQRLLLAQALLGTPEILLLDEPTAGLDPKERIAVRNYIAAMSEKKIILLATHIISDIESIADDVIFLENGRVGLSGSPMELINMVEGKVGEVDFGPEEFDGLCRKYPYGTVVQRMNRKVYRMVSDSLPEGAKVSYNISLEDVYMYIQQRN